MEIILSELEKKKCWKSFMKTQCRRNCIDASLASTFTIVKMRKFYERIANNETNNNRPRMKSSVWLENQLKAYQWLLVALSGKKGILIHNFTDQEWAELSSLMGKEERILEYQAIKLINERQSVKRKWEADETFRLQQIIKENPGNNKWNEIARTLFDSSQRKYFRSGKQCRERWFNHLDPQKRHGQWESTEDRLIAQQILAHGKKWSQIAKALGNQRTEHMVKNRFKTILIRLRKKYGNNKYEKQLLRNYMEELDGRATVEVGVHGNLDMEGLPIMESDNESSQNEIDEENVSGQRFDKYPSNFRDCEIQQVVTPCPIIYQTFTPNFLNTPNSLTFLMNYSFDQFQKNQNLFLKNN